MPVAELLVPEPDAEPDAVFDSPDEPLPPDPSPDPEGLASAVFESDPPASPDELGDPADADDFDVDVVLRSFFAQPVPLKTMDGAENAFRTGDSSQIGHSVGPASLMPWSASKRWPRGQRYS